jgi:thioredoxin type arsenate reductase
MAEGFARQLVRDGHRVYSAGTAPKEIHPMAIQVMKEVGIDISGQHSKGVESIPLNQIQRIVTLCGEAADRCPPLSEKVEHIHWSLPDPTLALGNEERILQVFRDVRDAIRYHVQKLFLTSTSQSTSASHLN